MELADILECLTFLQHDLDQELDTTNDKSLWREQIFAYLDKVRRDLNHCIPYEAFDDTTGREWINVASPLVSDVHLRGRLLLVDFFTYCCINCMHILPYLHQLERAISQTELAIIGVHCAKFDNEKLSGSVKRAVLRYGIEHAVLNDPEMRLWNLCQIICWPTLMLVGPNGEIVYKFIGEKNIDRLEAYVKIFVEYFKSKGQVNNLTRIPIKLLRDFSDLSKLCCPGKVAVNYSYIAIADTSNHRLLICDKETTVVRIDLETAKVTTIIGTGKQGRDYTGGRLGFEQEISSPWDITLFKNNILFIAMAGTHQIWAYALKDDAKLFNGRILVEAGKCICVAGSGREENRNTTYPLKAGFAQPSSLTLTSDCEQLIVADSESSAIRSLDLNSGAVKNICGGALDPLNLFAFGDHDDKGTDARLQHPLGVVWDSCHHSIIVADSYNHKLKTVHPKSRICTILQIAGVLQLNEPGGLAIDGTTNRLYIADTNNHSIKTVDLNELRVEEQMMGPILKRFASKHDVEALRKLLEMFEDDATNDDVVGAVQAFGPNRLVDVLITETADANDDNLMVAEEVQLIAECVRNQKLRYELTCDRLIVKLLSIIKRPDVANLLSSRVELVKQICRVVGNLCFDNDPARKSVMDNEGLEALINLVRSLLDHIKSGNELAIDEKLGMLIMGCLFNVADNDSCQKRLQHIDVLPMLIECVAIVPGDASCQAMNLLFNISNTDEWHRHFIANMPSILKIIDTLEDEEMLEILIDIMQSIFVKADESNKMKLLEFGLWDHLRKIVDRSVLVKPAASLMVVMLTDDGCMQRMFDGGKGPEYFLMREWLSKDSEELRTYGALAIGNFARGDDLCMALADDGVAAQLIDMLDARSENPQEREALEHAVLAGLRNLLIPKENKKSLIQCGIVDKLLSLLPIESYVVAFKYLGCVRMLVDRQPEMALKLGSNHDLVKAIVAWSQVEVHAGVKSEAMRVLCWVLKSNSADLIRSTVSIQGGIPAIVEMLKSEHMVMQNEAVIALSLLANGNPPEDVRRALSFNINLITKIIADIIKVNIPAKMEETGVTFEFLENVVTLVINICLVHREFQEAMAKEIKVSLNELNRLTRYVSLKDKVCKALHILDDKK
ncbi:NHL repeat-containing protein 2-like [Tropilaelaps mercedesae]|uniref:NHL repeat-containing protein 2-like n=1 Tax=Tropilaelaps mercedesae TaxID=418985 RepID=A0A1V9XCD7_9ACAR|nr:NHL repeat-containing protein 2-like [Tropilaelaps mercedesae]